jgi:hypothetical protein
VMFGKIKKLITDLGTHDTDTNAHSSLFADKLDVVGDGKDVTVTFTEAATRTNIASGETLATMFGKLKKLFTDLGTAAFVATIDFAAAVHEHGNITNDGKIGTAANRAIYTGTSGLMQAGTLPVSAGGTGSTSASAARTALGAAAYFSGAGVIPAGAEWNGPDPEGWYYRSVVAANVTIGDKVDITRVIDLMNVEEAVAIQEAWNLIIECLPSTDMLMFYAKKVPPVEIPFVWKLVR